MGIDTGLNTNERKPVPTADLRIHEDCQYTTPNMTEPLPGAGDGNRTRVISLEG